MHMSLPSQYQWHKQTFESLIKNSLKHTDTLCWLLPHICNTTPIKEVKQWWQQIQPDGQPSVGEPLFYEILASRGIWWPIFHFSNIPLIITQIFFHSIFLVQIFPGAVICNYTIHSQNVSGNHPLFTPEPTAFNLIIKCSVCKCFEVDWWILWCRKCADIYILNVFVMWYDSCCTDGSYFQGCWIPQPFFRNSIPHISICHV